MTKHSELIVLIKGGGEVASGVAHRLFRAHFKVCLTETPCPKAISRGVAFSEEESLSQPSKCQCLYRYLHS